MEKAGGYHLKEVTKVNITTKKTNQTYVPPNMIQWEHTITSVIFLPKSYNLNQILREQQTCPNWGSIYRITGLRFSKAAWP